MQNKIKVGIVNYINSKPLLYGLELENFKSKIEIIKGHPAAIAKLLIENKIDVGLVPVAIIPNLQTPYILGNHCIASNNKCASVGIFSNVPLQKIEKIILDYQSKTSVELTKWLIKNYWNISPKLVLAKTENYLTQIKSTTAGLVIGDRAFKQQKKSTYFFDLSHEWKKATNLPFVFACWVSNKKLDTKFITQFNKATGLGLNHLNEIIIQENFKGYDLHKYYTQNLVYTFNAQKRKSLNFFIQYLNNQLL